MLIVGSPSGSTTALALALLSSCPGDGCRSRKEGVWVIYGTLYIVYCVVVYSRVVYLVHTAILSVLISSVVALSRASMLACSTTLDSSLSCKKRQKERELSKLNRFLNIVDSI